MPKQLPLGKQHRFARQNNLSTLVQANNHEENSCYTTTSRIVSEEELRCPSLDYSAWRSNIESSKRCKEFSFVVVSPCSSSHTIQCTDRHSNDYQTAAPVSNLGAMSPVRLKRFSPIYGLANLTESTSGEDCTNQESENNALVTPTSSSCYHPDPRTSDAESSSSLGSHGSSPWGYFVEMGASDEDEILDQTFSRKRRSIEFESPPRTFRRHDSFGGRNAPCSHQYGIPRKYGVSYSPKNNDPYPPSRTRSNRNKNLPQGCTSRGSLRIPLSISRCFRETSSLREQEASLEDFILAHPDMDDTTYMLGNLSF